MCPPKPWDRPNPTVLNMMPTSLPSITTSRPVDVTRSTRDKIGVQTGAAVVDLSVEHNHQRRHVSRGRSRSRKLISSGSTPDDVVGAESSVVADPHETKFADAIAPWYGEWRLVEPICPMTPEHEATFASTVTSVPTATTSQVSRIVDSHIRFEQELAERLGTLKGILSQLDKVREINDDVQTSRTHFARSCGGAQDSVSEHRGCGHANLVEVESAIFESTLTISLASRGIRTRES